MSQYAVAILGLLMTASFAGCFAAEDGGPLGSTTPTSGTDTTPTGPGANLSDNTPPTVAVQILVNGTEVVLVNDTYAVPAAENVSFDASASTDAEDANLTFSWDFGDGNTSSEAIAVYVFSAPGNVTVNLTVTDSAGASVTQSLPLLVASAGPAPGTFVRTESKQFKGTVTQPVAEAFCGDSPAGMDNLSFKWEIAATEPDGTMVKVSRLVMKITQSSTNIDTDFYLNGPDGKEIGSSHHFEPLDGAEKGFDLTGEWPAGTYTVLVKSCASVNNAVTVDMSADLVAA